MNLVFSLESISFDKNDAHYGVKYFDIFFYYIVSNWPNA